MKSTHWTVSDDPYEWADDPAETPEQAVEQFLEARSDSAADMAYDILAGNPQDVDVYGYYETDTPLHGDDQFDGYELGQKYYAPTGETLTVRVSRSSWRPGKKRIVMVDADAGEP